MSPDDTVRKEREQIKMTLRNCDHCGKEYQTGNLKNQKSRTARFCSDQCRYDATNEKRRIKRQSDLIAEYIFQLKMTVQETKNQQNRAIAESAISALDTLTSDFDFPEYDKKKWGKK